MNSTESSIKTHQHGTLLGTDAKQRGYSLFKDKYLRLVQLYVRYKSIDVFCLTPRILNKWA